MMSSLIQNPVWYSSGIALTEFLVRVFLIGGTMAWRWTALLVYLIICIYDFVVVPVWFGLNRPDLSAFITHLNTVEDPLIQLELMKKLTGQHHPFTLLGGGLFHLAFGALLTGSVFGQKL